MTLGILRRMNAIRISVFALIAAACLASSVAADAGGGAVPLSSQPALVVAQGAVTNDGRLAPRYDPVPPEEPPCYNNAYLFSMTRGLADSTIHPAGKAPLFLFAVPIDILLLPVTLISGFFG